MATSSGEPVVRRSMKVFTHGVAMVLAIPAGALCFLERIVSRRSEHVFLFFGQCYALLPGLPGMYMRRAFFRLTLEHCSPACFIGFGSLFTHRRVVVEDGVYIGQYSLIGCALLRTRSLIGSQVSLLSGPALHEWDGEGWLPSNHEKLQRIEVGPASWVGERAVIMADVGAGAMVAAGSVVSSPVPAGVVVAGNPARFVRRMREPTVHDERRTAPAAIR